jgi:hypothetical protein
MLQNWECSPVNCDLVISTQLHSLRIHNATLQNAKKGEEQNVVVSNLHCQSKQFKDMLVFDSTKFSTCDVSLAATQKLDFFP